MKNLGFIQKQALAIIGGLALLLNASAAISSPITEAFADIDISSLSVRAFGSSRGAAVPTYTSTVVNSKRSLDENGAFTSDADKGASGIFATTQGDDIGDGSATAERIYRFVVSGNGFLSIAADYFLSNLFGVDSKPLLDSSASALARLTLSLPGSNTVLDSFEASISSPETPDDSGILQVGTQVFDGDILLLTAFVSVTAANALNGSTDPSLVPVPAAVWLFGTALIGLTGIGRKQKA
ncbi:MAG: hypothetical protein CTY34_03525 [Methylobacter sp.]|nr:MAG: hypothetical protein CTY34_03525 [Methylobacter sp.]PPD04711.1 MAG: hypothetical protein CTY29_04440 [Methylobacter sp.]PPD23373.1 MAG: hypothetical protein CTY24_04540 [Methylobacter sp.]